MKEFIAENTAIEVSGMTTLSFVNSMRKGKETRLAILEKHGITPAVDTWVNLQDWLNAFKEVAETVGDMNLFLMGTAVVKKEYYPEGMSLENILRGMDIGFHMEHRLNGEIMFNPNTGQMTEGIGHCLVTEFDEKNRKATICIDSPYPSKYAEGAMWQMLELFKPADSKQHEVKIDISKERRSTGGDSCTFLLSW